jgi:L-Ala-D/L-Glu epimerase
MTRALSWKTQRWPLREPFAISRGVQTEVPALTIRLRDSDGFEGRGEACGVTYAGETPETMAAQIEGLRGVLEGPITRQELLSLMPAGGARFAVDAALWDLEAKRTGRSAFELAGFGGPGPVTTAYSIGIRSLDAYEASAAERSAHALLKIKVAGEDPLAAVRAVRRGAPRSALIVDPNQAWSVDQLQALAPKLAELGVVLLEQPIPVGQEASLEGYDCPIPLCADELISDSSDLPKVFGRFQVINIKLDKTGGLTEALRLARAALAEGLDLMVGCMAGSSLCMAPATIVAQQCRFVDLDGPLLQAQDWPCGLDIRDGVMPAPDPQLWG